MKRLLLLEILVLGIFVLLGNGLRSVGMATASVTQGEFASFLNISLHRTEILIEALLAGALIALLLAPFILSRRSALRIARNAAALAALSYAAIGLTMIVNPDLLTREIVVIACFAMAGFAVAFFAPLSQLVIAGVGDERQRTALTTVWTAAQPIAFLITPQLVKYVAFDIGTGNFFLILAALPLLFLALVPLVVLHIKKPDEPDAPETPIPWRRLSIALGVILIFEGMTASVTLVGFLNPISIAFAVALAVACIAVYVARRGLFANMPALPANAVFLLSVLLLIQIPTTGLFDSAYLLRHLCSMSFMADRATGGAVFQIAGVFGAGAVLMRWPPLQTPLLAAGLVLVLAGTMLIALYPTRPNDDFLFNVSKLVMSLGMGISTAVLIRAILTAAGNNKMVLMAPAFAIIIGTEIGIEVLEIVFETAELLGADEDGAYFAVFMAQVVAMMIAVTMMAFHTVTRMTRDGVAESATAARV